MKYPKKTKKKISEANSGRIRSEEAKQKTSEALQGEKNPMFGKHHTDESLQLMSENRKGKGTGENNAMADLEIRKKAIENQRKSLKNKNTGLERKIQKALQQLGIEFICNKTITLSKFITLPDMFIKPNICIYTDGCYWHHCSKCFPKPIPVLKIQWRTERDRELYNELPTVGYRVIQIWEHELKGKSEKELQELVKMKLG